MGNYLADGINNGARLGAEAYMMAKRLEKEEQERRARQAEAQAERDLRLKLAADSMANEGTLLDRRLHAEADNLAKGYNWRSTEADKDRTFTASQKDLDRELDRDPGSLKNVNLGKRNLLLDKEIEEASARLLSYNAKPTQPMATVTAPFGADGKVSYQVPTSEIAKQQNAPEPYASPYSAEIAKVEQDIAQQRLQMAEGDTRTGFLNLSKRTGVISKQQQKLARLRALEIQDRLEKGLISPEQADAEARKYLPR